jgi:pSer/pThr/pTyr-binding forkhead associated (FHA) protein
VLSPGSTDAVEIPLIARMVRIGRAQDNHVVLRDGTVSRHHAALVCRDGRWVLVDTSRNGTRVDGAGSSGARYLRGGERLVLGGTELQFVLA